MPDQTPERIGFAGTPAFADRVFLGLLDHGIRPALVLTAPNARQGRGQKYRATPVRARARSNGIPVLQPTTLHLPRVMNEIAAYELDLLIVVAYGLILPPGLLQIPRLGCINLHPSLLPRWRGAAPIERAIMTGDAETGISIMQMEPGLDTGPLLAVKRLLLDDSMTGDGLRAALASIGLNVLVRVLANIETLEPEPQADDGVIYAEKLVATDQRIDWTQSSRLVARQIHALNSAAPAYSNIGAGEDSVRVRFLRADHALGDSEAPPGTVLEALDGQIEIACGAGKISVLEASVLRGSGRRLSARQLLNGFASTFRPGNRFGE